MLFTFQSVKKLNRQSNDVFLGTISLGIIKSWNFPFIEPHTVNVDVVFVNYDTLVNASTTEIQVTNPAFIYSLPNGKENDEYPVLFISKNNYLPYYCEQHLMSCDFFNRLIEKDDRLSANSTKLMTRRSLQDILKNFVKTRIDPAHWPRLSEDMISYLHTLIKKYTYLDYLPVAQRKAFRKKSIADASFAWEFYFRFFLETWRIEDSAIIVPNMSKPFEYQNWLGNFFDRENPLWKFYVGSNGKFLFQNAFRDSIYEIWKEWVKGA